MFSSKNITIYSICLNGLIAALLLILLIYKQDAIVRFIKNEPPSQRNNYIDSVHAFYQRVDQQIITSSYIFVGDSHIQGLAVSSVSVPAVNFGIGMDTANGVLNRLTQYKSDDVAKAIILQVGFNDLFEFSNEEIISNIRDIIVSYPSEMPILLHGVMFVDATIEGNGFVKLTPAINQRIKALNNKYKKMASEYANVNYLNMNEYLASNHNLLSKNHIGDGIHLSTAAYAIWANQLKIALAALADQKYGEIN